jgi:Tol biopolymer transport system component
MKKIFLLASLIITFSAAYCQISPEIQLVDSARIFGKNVISNGDFEFSTTFTPDSKTVYFSRASINFQYMAIFYSIRNGSEWGNPKTVSFTENYRDTDPFVSADGRRLYFISDRPVNGKPYIDFDYHFFYVELKGNEVISEPVLLNLSVPTGLKLAYPTFADNGNLYFSAVEGNDSEIYSCIYKNGSYSSPQKLSFNDQKYVDYDPVIAKDESFIIFTSNNRKGYGGGDLWISFKKGETWSEPVNMGSKVNTKGNDGTPALSRDNKTLFFSSFREKIDKSSGQKGKKTTKEILDQLHSYKNGMRSLYEINISDLREQSAK